MAVKKLARKKSKKKVGGRKKSASQRPPARRPKTKRPPKTKRAKSPPRKQSPKNQKNQPRKKILRKKKGAPASGLSSGGPDFDVMTSPESRGLGLESGGQAGDTEGLSRAELADSESVEELLEEGQAFEAGVVSGVEGAPDADEGEVTTREVPEDDVPAEYRDDD